MSTAKTSPKKPADRKAPARKPKAGAIDIPIGTPKPVAVSFGGEVFNARRIKGSVGISLLDTFQVTEGQDPAELRDKMEGIVDLLFTDKDAERIRERLADADDGLDYPHIVQALQLVIEAATGNPTM